MQISSCYQLDVLFQGRHSRTWVITQVEHCSCRVFMSVYTDARLCVLALCFLQYSRDACQNTLAIISATWRYQQDQQSNHYTHCCKQFAQLFLLGGVAAAADAVGAADPLM